MAIFRFCAFIMLISFICITGAAQEARALQCNSCLAPQETKLPMQFFFCGLEPATQYYITLTSGGEFTGDVFSGLEQMTVQCGRIYFSTPADMEPGKSLVISVGVYPNTTKEITGEIKQAVSGAPVKAYAHFEFYSSVSAATENGRFSLPTPIYLITGGNCTPCNCSFLTGEGCPRGATCFDYLRMSMCCYTEPY